MTENYYFEIKTTKSAIKNEEHFSLNESLFESHFMFHSLQFDKVGRTLIIL